MPAARARDARARPEAWAATLLRYCGRLMADLGTQLTAIITPFDDQGNIDEESYVRVLHHVCEHGSDGVVVCGTTGEASTLADDEHLRVIELTVQEIPE